RGFRIKMQRIKTIPFAHVVRVLRYLAPYRKLAVTSVLLTISSSLAALLVPWPLKIIVDNVLQKQPLPPFLPRLPGDIAHHQIQLLLLAVAAGLLTALATNTIHVFSNYVNTRIDQSITLDFRSHLFMHAQRMSLAFHDRRRSGMLIYMINSQGDAPAGL